MKGRGLAYGAISIVNAIATGNGSSLGVQLKTEAEVELIKNTKTIDVKVDNSNSQEDDHLARCVVKKVLTYFGIENYGARVRTKSDIPIGKGLKSSSAASNAIVLATTSALQKKLDDFTSINLGVDASLEAGVTKTGAFDDACASFLGGLVITENLNRALKKREIIEKDYEVVIYVPRQKLYTKDIDVNKLNIFHSLFSESYRLTKEGKYWDAMILNGLLTSTSLEFSMKPVIDALSAGAISAGLSGTGPAISAICDSERIDEIKSAWSRYPGEIILTKINYEKAKMIS